MIVKLVGRGHLIVIVILAIIVITIAAVVVTITNAVVVVAVIAVAVTDTYVCCYAVLSPTALVPDLEQPTG
jgi:hypothetical protein